MVCVVGSLIGWDLASLQVRFPIFVRETIPPFLNGLHSKMSVRFYHRRLR